MRIEMTAQIELTWSELQALRDVLSDVLAREDDGKFGLSEFQRETIEKVSALSSHFKMH